MDRRLLVIVLAIAVAVAAASGCGSDSSSTDTGGGTSTAAGGSGKSAAKPKIAYLGFAQTDGYSVANYEGVKKAVAAAGGTTENLEAETNPAKQVSQIQAAAASGKYNGLVVFGVFGVTAVPAVKQAMGRGIKVVAIGLPLGADFTTTDIQVPGLSGVATATITGMGTDLGNLTVKACEGVDPCKVGYLPGDNTLPLEVTRTKTALNIIKQHPNIKVVSTAQQGGFSTAFGQKAAQNLISGHPDVNVITLPNDAGAVGAARALKQAGLVGKIKVIGNGSSIEGVENIRSGAMFGSAILCPETEGEIAGKMVVDAVQGKAVDPKTVDTRKSCGYPSALDKTNIADFKGQWRAG